MWRFLVRWQSGASRAPPPPLAAAPAAPPTSTSQILNMWKTGQGVPAGSAVPRPTLASGATSSSAAGAAGQRPAASGAAPQARPSSLVNSLASIRAEMERNRRLQAERRTQVERLQLEKRSLQDKAREIRRGGMGLGGEDQQQLQRQQGQGFAQGQGQQAQQGQHQQHQHQHQQWQRPAPRAPQLGLGQGAGMVSNFSAAGAESPLLAAGLLARRQAPSGGKGGRAGSGAGMARASLAGSMRGLRLRKGQRLSFERGQRTRQGRTLTLLPVMTIRQLAVGMRLKLAPLFQKLAAAGEVHRSPSEVVDCDVAQLIAEELGMVVRRKDDRRRDRVRTSPPLPEALAKEGAPHRAPVVTVMGHVDHGKTSLLDALRSASVAAREAGGITQAIAAFSVAMRAASEGTGAVRAPGGKAAKVARASEQEGGEAAEGAGAGAGAGAEAEAGGESGEGAVQGATKGGRARGKAAKQARQAVRAKEASDRAAEAAAAAPALQPSNVDVMTFIDTPGHALFSSMRKHGTSVTDIVVLVVDGKDGVMPQTLECMELITASAMPCVVAVTKCDTTDPADAVARCAEALLKHGFATEPYGGDVPLVPVSARTGLGLDALKAALSFQAELLDLRARASVLPEAVVLDSRLVPGQGQVVDAIVTMGTLRVGDYIVAEGETGRVKALFTDAVGAQSLNKRLLGGGAATAAAAGAGGRKEPGGGKGKAGGSEEAPAGGSGGIRLQGVQEALPGTPVRIVGLKGTPPAGADLLGVEDEARAAAVLEGRARRAAAAEASSISAVDAAVRKADRKAYQGRRDRAVAFTLAASRERQRGNMRKAGQIIPTRLQQQPWEVAILAEARTGSIVGVGSSGRKERTQGGQQSAYSATSVAGGEGGSSAPAAPVASLLLRADSMGSLAALKDAVGRIGLATSAVVPRVVTAVVGEVTEKDVEYAANMGAHIVGFGCKASPAVLKLAERKKIKVNVGKVIYHVLDALCGDLGAYLPPEMEEEVTSTAEIKQVFNLNANKAKDATAAAGCVITMGTFLKAAKLFRVMREGEVVHEVKELANLQHLQKKVESVKKGDECGISLNGFKGFQVGDRIETVSIKRKALKIQVSWD